MDVKLAKRKYLIQQTSSSSNFHIIQDNISSYNSEQLLANLTTWYTHHQLDQINILRNNLFRPFSYWVLAAPHGEEAVELQPSFSRTMRPHARIRLMDIVLLIQPGHCHLSSLRSKDSLDL